MQVIKSYFDQIFVFVCCQIGEKGLLYNHIKRDSEPFPDVGNETILLTDHFVTMGSYNNLYECLFTYEFIDAKNANVTQHKSLIPDEKGKFV